MFCLCCRVGNHGVPELITSPEGVSVGEVPRQCDLIHQAIQGVCAYLLIALREEHSSL